MQKRKGLAYVTTEQLKNLPKIELHCHLDGSLSMEFMKQKLGRSVSYQEIQVSKDCDSLAEYLEKFDLPGQCLKDADGLRKAGYDFLRSASRENVIYTEVRFAPLLSVSSGMGTEQVIASLLEGLEKGRQDFGVEYNVITCAMRHHSPEENLAMLQASQEFLGAGVCAADLAGAEASYPMSGFLELFEKVRQMGMPFTIHAGECGNAKNIADAVEAGASRIGHGIAMTGKPKLQQICKDRHIGVEMCPVSNLQTKAVKHVEDYPLREFLDAGLLASIHTDNRTVSGTSLTKELGFVQEVCKIHEEEIRLLQRNAVETAFADDVVKERLWKRLA